MPVPKPRRDPTQTAEAFEALYYPEIIDRIFDNAPRDFLLDLRKVCKAWKARSDELLVNHVQVRSAFYGGGPNRWDASTPNGNIPRRNWHNCSTVVKRIKVLDMFKGTYPPWVRHIDTLDMLRYIPASGVSFLLRPSGQIELTNADNELVLPSADPAIEELVLCIGTAAYRMPSKHLLPRFQTVTVVCLAPPSPSNKGHPFKNSKGRLFVELVCWIAGELSRLDRAAPFSINLVNCDSWFSIPDSRYGPNGYDDLWPAYYYGKFHRPDNLRKIYRSQDELKEAIQASTVTSSTDPTKTVLDSLSFLTLDEYRAKVGDDRLKWATELVAEPQRFVRKKPAAKRP